MAQAALTTTTLPARLGRAPSDVKALAALYEAYTATADAIAGIINQPRAKDSSAADVLEAEFDAAMSKAETVATRLAAMQIVDHFSVNDRAHVLVDYAFRCGEGLTETIAILASAASVAQAPIMMN